MRVRVGISTRNRAELLVRAIESVQRQDYPDIEIAVIDDASTDDTPLLRSRFPTVIWDRVETQKGLMFLRNRLMTETEADLYVTLDDDAWFLSTDEISSAVELMTRRPELAAIGFDILSPEQPNSRIRTEAQSVNTFIGCGAMLKLSLVKKVGFFLPVPGLYGGEEVDLSVRMLEFGSDIVMLPGVHVWHEKYNFQSDIEWKHRSGVCNDLVFTLRRYPMPQLLWQLPLKIAGHLRFAVKNQLLKAGVAGISLFLRSFAEAVRMRAPVSVKTLREFRHRGRLI